MATFLAERYWPGVTPAGAGEATARLASAGATIVETVVADADEVCFWYVEAGSTAEVEAAFRAATVPVDRIAAVRRVRAHG